MKDQHTWIFPWQGMLLTLLAIALLASSPLHAASHYVRNGDFNTKGGVKPYFTQENVDKLRQAGWTCPDADSFPAWCSGYGVNVTLEWFATGGKYNDGYIRLKGKDGFLSTYHGLPLEPVNLVTFWTRGTGVLRFGFLGYKFENGNTYGGVRVPHLDVQVNSEHWVRYRFILRSRDDLHNVHTALSVPEGMVDVDEMDIAPTDAAMALAVDDAVTLYGKGALVENQEWVAVDEAFLQWSASFAEAVKAVKASAKIDKALAEAIVKHTDELSPYVTTKGLKTVAAVHYNDMIVWTRVCRQLLGQSTANAPQQTNAQPAAVAASPAPDKPDVHKPGERAARPDTVTITEIKSNKVRYNENESATSHVTVANTRATGQQGTLIATLISDLDTRREVGRTAFTLGAGQQGHWDVRYSVGPETYGRTLEVRFVDEAGAVVDTWREFYAVAAEWFRVQQHTYGAQSPAYRVDPWVTYMNQMHNFASEPSDWGAYMTDTEQYLSGQARYHVIMAHRKGYYTHFRNLGVMGTFYQNLALGGQMGYEIARRHPEFVLFDANGQYSVDPVYGGYPNPMELASPLEIGPKRKVAKPYLDRKLTGWHHTMVNSAREDVIRHMAESIKTYAKELGAAGIYVDGNVGVYRGYNYDGTLNVPTDSYDEYVRLNARNHRLFNEILKQDDPQFGTWFNWSYGSNEYYIPHGMKCALGSGTTTVGDTKDDAMRAVTSFKNVMLLVEYQHSLIGSQQPDGTPEGYFNMLLKERDHIIQPYGANMITGYYGISPVDKDEPGPSRWGWPTLNYFGAQITASQFHVVTFFRPSMRPWLQFMTCYSRFFWAPDIKTLPADQQTIVVNAPAGELWWKRTVYTREREDGHDLIVHLVRIPPTKRWDLEWTVEPEPLAGVTIDALIGNGQLQSVTAMRPYYYEEEQQPVETALQATMTNGTAQISVPPFRYHTMVVFRVKTK
jgi:hypothetical protein